VAEVNTQSEDAAVTTARRDYDDDLTTRRKPMRPTKLYALKESVILCVCSPDLEVTQAFSFVECISRWLVKSENVIALTCEFKTSHLTDEDDLPNAFLRGLSSERFIGSKLSKSLEQPNMIAGTPAALLSYCQIFKIPAVLYVVYADSFIADSITAQPLIQLFSKLQINLLKKDKLTFKKRSYYGAEIESNLYM
jgi:proteasome assembly chaperone 1